MTRALCAFGTAAALLWWAPTLAADVLAAAPYIVAARGARYRVRRVRRLIARGDLDEAERVADALTREHRAAVRWRASARP